MSGATVSVCVAACRTPPHWLEQALRSALQQTRPVHEVLVGDDSPDARLADVVAALGDARVQYRHRRSALGVAANHADLLRRATGRHVAILNHDDRLEPEFVEALQPELLATPGATLAFCDHHVLDAQGAVDAAASDACSRRWGRDRLPAGPHRPFAGLVVAQAVPLAMGSLIDAAALRPLLRGRWVAEAGPAYDLWLAYLLARTGGAAVYVPRRLAGWRAHAGSLSHAAGDAWLRGAARCWDAMAADPAFAAHRAQVAARRARAWAGCARLGLRRGLLHQALADAWRAARPAPAATGDAR